MSTKTAEELGLTESDLAAQVKLSNEVIDEVIHEEKLTTSIRQTDKLIKLCEERLVLLRELRVSLLKELYPDLNWQRDIAYAQSGGWLARISVKWARPIAKIAAARFLKEQATAGKQE